jgi:hypothetical protein
LTCLESGCKVKSFPSRTFLLQALAFKGEEKKTGEGGKLAWFPEEPGLILHRTPGNFSPDVSDDVKNSEFSPYPLPSRRSVKRVTILKQEEIPSPSTGEGVEKLVS